MNPSLTLALSLVGSLVLAGPTLLGLARGSMGLETACFRYLIAFAIARVGVGVLGRLVVDYATKAEMARLAQSMGVPESAE